MSVEFESPATRVIEQFSGKDNEQFRIPVTLPDITFLRALSVQGRLRYLIGEVTTTDADAITITPAVGETFFIYRIVLSQTTSGVTFSLFNNENERFRIGLGVSGVVSANTEIIDMMDSLVGNSVKVIRVFANITTNSVARVSLFGWVENTSRIRDVTI